MKCWLNNIKSKERESKMVDQNEKEMDRTSSGLRNVLFDEIDSLRSGASNPARARSLSMLANTALKSVEVEVEFHKYVSDVSKHKGSAVLGSLELGGKSLNMGGEEVSPVEEKVET